MLVGATVVPQAGLAAEAHRSWYALPSSNGFGGVVADLGDGRIHHFREHSFATEEPRWNPDGTERWSGQFPESVYARDLLGGVEFWLQTDGAAAAVQGESADLDRSGWRDPSGVGTGGTGIVALVSRHGDLEVTREVFAPWDLARASFVVALTVENVGSVPSSDLGIIGHADLHLGPGRPGPASEIGTSGESITAGTEIVEERGFAGVVALVLDPEPARLAVLPGDSDPTAPIAAGAPVPEGPADPGVGADQRLLWSWELGALAPGERQTVGLVAAHHGDPFAIDVLATDLDLWRAGLDIEGLRDRELAGWAAFQARLQLPAGLNAVEERVLRQGAAMLRMAQVREEGAWLREVLWDDATPRHHPTATLPAWVPHRGRGAVLASLPPGQWTYAWPRDASYAIAGMSRLGMLDEAREALRFLLEAETGHFAGWDELAHYPMVPYQVSLCRHHGFGREESDTSGGGDFNFEFDGAGLVLWALAQWLDAGGDATFLDDHWPTIRDEVAGFLVALTDPGTGLLFADSSIWEHHWLGLERQWTYSNLTAVAGLCAAAEMAESRGDSALAEAWRDHALAMRAAIEAQLIDGQGALVSNAEEASTGAGYWDMAVIEGVAMGLFDPADRIGPATIDALMTHLRVPGGGGFARNDDRTDGHALSPWGSPYDSDEWVVMDLRFAVAARAAGLSDLADHLLAWVTDQSAANFDAIGETYDPWTADYTNNAPMVGFGPGAYALALADRAAGGGVEPACGRWAPDRWPEPAPPPVEPPWPSVAAPPAEADGCGTGLSLLPIILLARGPARRRRAHRP